LTSYEAYHNGQKELEEAEKQKDSSASEETPDSIAESEKEI